MAKKGVIVLNNIPKSLQAGERLKGWIDIKVGATVTAEKPIILEVIGLARSSWVVQPDSQYATPQDRIEGKVKRLINETTYWTTETKLAEAQVIYLIFHLVLRFADEMHLLL
jgi:hypothetical protein